MGSSSARESRAKCGEGEYDHSCQVVHIAITKGGTDADNEFDFVVDSLRANVGGPAPGSGNNG